MTIFNVGVALLGFSSTNNLSINSWAVLVMKVVTSSVITVLLAAARAASFAQSYRESIRVVQRGAYANECMNSKQSCSKVITKASNVAFVFGSVVFAAGNCCAHAVANWAKEPEIFETVSNRKPAGNVDSCGEMCSVTRRLLASSFFSSEG